MQCSSSLSQGQGVKQPTHVCLFVRKSLRHTFKLPFYQRLWLLYVKSWRKRTPIIVQFWVWKEEEKRVRPTLFQNEQSLLFFALSPKIFIFGSPSSQIKINSFVFCCILSLRSTLVHKITFSPFCVLFLYPVREIELAWNIHRPWGESPSQTFFWRESFVHRYVESFNLQGMFLSVCEVT